MNIEGMLWLLNNAAPGDDAWSSRASRNIARNLDAIRDPKTYLNFDRYKRCINDINRMLHQASSGDDRISLSDYDDRSLSPFGAMIFAKQRTIPKTIPFFLIFPHGSGK